MIAILTRKVMILAAAAACAVVTGCAAPPDPATVQSLSLHDLCWSINSAKIVGHGGLVAGLGELRRRKLFTEADISAIGTRQIFIGMSESAMVCAFAGVFDAVNTTRTAYGVDVQYVVTSLYGPYIYTTNGKVTAVQD
jgi:hypothetical protein